MITLGIKNMVVKPEYVHYQIAIGFVTPRIANTTTVIKVKGITILMHCTIMRFQQSMKVKN